jgi:hypothetical protein
MKYEFDKKYTAGSSYSTTRIAAFTSGDDSSTRMILQSFVASTKQNLANLKLYHDRENHRMLSNVAHKMLPLFKSLEVNELIPILELMEEKKLAPEEWNSKTLELIQKVEQLIATIRKDYDIE